MNVGLIGTGAIAHKHGDSYREINYRVVAVSNRGVEKGREFARKYGAEFLSEFQDVCARPDVDYIDVCTFPDSHLDVVKACVANGKPVLLQKPIALTLADARAMIDLTQRAGLRLGVVSQHRFDEASMFLRKAITDGRLGKILQADGYVKWHRPQSYYDRPGKGTWAVEGGGALINQGIHTVDVLQYLAGPVSELFANWQLGAGHKMESEDVINAVVRYESGATGVIQAATAIHPGYPEKIEIHGTKGSAIITGDRLTAWDVQGDAGEDAPVSTSVDSGAADPMAISLEPIKRQFLDFGNAVKNNTKPLVDGEEGYRALQIVLGAYESARSGKLISLR
jgi:UDP-N-acetyl-2-amino-2-deoxyglucuronate dehydrogenase